MHNNGYNENSLPRTNRVTTTATTTLTTCKLDIDLRDFKNLPLPPEVPKLERRKCCSDSGNILTDSRKNQQINPEISKSERLTSSIDSGQNSGQNDSGTNSLSSNSSPVDLQKVQIYYSVSRYFDISNTCN